MQIVATGIDVVEDIAVDWIGKNLYWTDYGMETIEVVNLAGEHRMVLFSENITNPRAIEVDPRDGYVDKTIIVKKYKMYIFATLLKKYYQ